MKQVLDFAADPKHITEAPYDAIWICLKDRAAPAPLESRALQWLDWKLQGQISRLILDGKPTDGEPVFVPTMRKVSAQFLVVTAKPGAEKMRSACTGLGLKRVLVFFEDFEKAGSHAKQWTEASGSIETVDVGMESPAEGAA